MLFTAPSGWGKTPMVGTADQRATGGPKAIYLGIDPEGGLSAAYAGSTMDMVDCKTWEDLDAATQMVRPKVFDGTYGIVIVDSITEAQRSMVRSDLNKKHKQNPGKYDLHIPGQDVYLRTQNQLVDYVKALNGWPCITIWTAHQMEWEDSEGESRYLPMVHGQKGSLANEVMGYMMIHGNGQFVATGKEDEDDIRRMWFTNSGPYRARDRTNRLPRFLDSPTIPQIMELVNKTAPAPKKTAARRPLRKAAR